MHCIEKENHGYSKVRRLGIINSIKFIENTMKIMQIPLKSKNQARITSFLTYRKTYFGPCKSHENDPKHIPTRLYDHFRAKSSQECFSI